jgi:hypothetical protein
MEEKHVQAGRGCACGAVRAALEALLDWCREHTGPTQPDSPHALLVAAHEALASAELRS